MRPPNPKAVRLWRGKFFVKGQVRTQADEDYTSHNTRRLNVEETIAKIKTTEYIQEMLKEESKA